MVSRGAGVAATARLLLVSRCAAPAACPCVSSSSSARPHSLGGLARSAVLCALRPPGTLLSGSLPPRAPAAAGKLPCASAVTAVWSPKSSSWVSACLAPVPGGHQSRAQWVSSLEGERSGEGAVYYTSLRVRFLPGFAPRTPSRGCKWRDNPSGTQTAGSRAPPCDGTCVLQTHWSAQSRRGKRTALASCSHRAGGAAVWVCGRPNCCLLYTSDAADDWLVV